MLFVAFVSSNMVASNVATPSGDFYHTQSGGSYVTSVTAQNIDGSKSKGFKIMRSQMANGSSYFYAQDGNGTYEIMYADNNKYKPFYVMDNNGERWYFACKELDRGSGRTNQW